MRCYCHPTLSPTCGLGHTSYDTAKSVAGLKLTNSSSGGKVWEFTKAQSIAAGSTVLCSIFGIPPTQVWVSGTQRFGGLFLQSQSLQDFPFDTQNAGFTIEASDGSAMYVLDDVAFAMGATAGSTIVPGDGVGGWDVKSSTAKANVRYDKNLDSSFSSAQFLIIVKRIPNFFVARFVTPLCLIMLMGMGSMFFSQTGGFQGPRYMIPVTSFAMTISFLFVAAAQVPVLTYSTRLDK